MALVSDFWDLKAEMLEVQLTLNKIAAVVVDNPRYAKQYSAAMKRLQILEDDMVNVLEELNNSDELTIDVQFSLPGQIPEIPISKIGDLETWWGNSIPYDRLFLMMSNGVRKEIATSFIYSKWRDVGLGVKEKLELAS